MFWLIESFFYCIGVVLGVIIFYILPLAALIFGIYYIVQHPRLIKPVLIAFAGICCFGAVVGILLIAWQFILGLLVPALFVWLLVTGIKVVRGEV